MASALNNLKRVDMPLNKETNPNQTKPGIYIEKLKSGHFRIIDLFPSFYEYWYESITLKSNRTSSDPNGYDEYIQNGGGRGHRRAVWRGEELPPPPLAVFFRHWSGPE